MASRRAGRRREEPAPPGPDMGEVEQLVREVRQKLRSAADPRTAEEHRRYFRAPLECYGVKAPDVHRIGTDLTRHIRSKGLAFALELADPLWSSGNLEEGMVADRQVGAFTRHIGGGEFDRFDRWVDSLSNWVNTDGIANHLISRALAGRPSMAGRLLEWAGSPSPWRRRAAVVSFGPLVREGRFLTDALVVAERLMEDEDELVQEGVGLMLMEAVRLQPERVVEFLKLWKGKYAPILLRTATEKMSPAHRSQLE